MVHGPKLVQVGSKLAQVGPKLDEGSNDAGSKDEGSNDELQSRPEMQGGATGQVPINRAPPTGRGSSIIIIRRSPVVSRGIKLFRVVCRKGVP